MIVFTSFYRRPSSSTLRERQGQITNFNEPKTENKSLPLLDQHINIIKSHSSVLIPVAGAAAVLLRFHQPFREYFDLLYGLCSNIVDSITGVS